MPRVKLGAGLNKEEREYIEALFNYDELWDYCADHYIEQDRVERLQGRLNKAIKGAVDEEAIDLRRK